MKRGLSLLLSLLLLFGCVTALAEETVSAADVAGQFVSDSPTDGMYCSASANTLRHYESIEDDPYFENGGFMFGTTNGKMKAYVICVDFEDCVGAERIEYGDKQNVFVTDGMEYDYSKPETYYNTIFAGSDGFGDAFTGNTEYAGMIEYFKQVSYGLMDMEVVFINSLVPNEDGSWPWFRMPGEQSDWAIQYASEVEDYRIFGRLYEGALDVAYEMVPDLDIEDISFLYVIPPINTFGFRSGLQGGAGIDTAFSYQDQAVILRDTELRHAPLLTTKGGKVIGSGTTIAKGARGYKGADTGFFRVMAHETSHGLGLIDDYTYSGTDHMSEDAWSWSSPMDDWGIMDGMTNDVPDWLAWYKYKAGWIDDDEIAVVMPGETKEIVISALGSKEGAYDQGVKMVLIPTEWRTVDTFNNETWNPNGKDYNFLDWFTPVWLGGEEYALKSFPTGYVLESRRDVGADYLNTSGEAGTQGTLITQLSNLTWETGHGAAGLKIMANVGTDTTNACLGVGAYAGVNGDYSWEDTSRGVKVEVIESTEYYDKVRITYTGVGEGVTKEGEKTAVERNYTGALELSAAYAEPGADVTVSFDLKTLGVSADNGNKLSEEAPDPVIVQAGSPLGVGAGVSGYTMTVTYPEALELRSGTADFSATTFKDNGDNTLTVFAKGSTMKEGEILRLTFTVKEDAAPGEYAVEAVMHDVDLRTLTGEAGVKDGVDVAVKAGIVTVTAEPTYTLTGLITESKAETVGVPADIVLYTAAGEKVAETASGTHGVYSIEGVPAGEYYFTADKHLYDTFKSEVFTVTGDTEQNAQLQLTVVTITGHVYDDNGNPIPGAKVQLVDGGFLPVGEAVYTDENGAYIVDDAPLVVNDFYTMTAHAEGYGNSNGQNYGIGKGDLFHVDGDIEGKDIILSTTYLISGTIKPASAEATYYVQLYKDGEKVGEPVQTVTTSTESRWYGTVYTCSYEISGVLPGEGYSIEVSGPDCLTRRSTEFMVRSTNVLQKNLTVDLVADAAKADLVFTVDGAALSGAAVTVKDGLGYGLTPVTTAEDGSFSVTLPAGTYTFTAAAADGTAFEMTASVG